jgi:hypothetical protein
LLTKIADERVVNEIMLLIDGAIIHAQMGMETDEVITSLKRALAGYPMAIDAACFLRKALM